jgi:hypothetical protein
MAMSVLVLRGESRWPPPMSLPTATAALRAGVGGDTTERCDKTGGLEIMPQAPEIPLYTTGDETLKRAGKPLRTRRLGLDPDEAGYFAGLQGRIYEWEYPWGVLVLKRRRAEDGSGPHCYRVVEKREK